MDALRYCEKITPAQEMHVSSILASTSKTDFTLIQPNVSGGNRMFTATRITIITSKDCLVIIEAYQNVHFLPVLNIKSLYICLWLLYQMYNAYGYFDPPRTIDTYLVEVKESEYAGGLFRTCFLSIAFIQFGNSIF